MWAKASGKRPVLHIEQPGHRKEDAKARKEDGAPFSDQVSSTGIVIDSVTTEITSPGTLRPYSIGASGCSNWSSRIKVGVAVCFI